MSTQAVEVVGAIMFIILFVAGFMAIAGGISEYNRNHDRIMREREDQDEI